MTHTDLIEEVARILSPNCLWNEGFVNDHYERRRERAREKARAISALIIEACAKEAETASAFYAHGDGELWIANKIAEDIRALAAKPEGA